MRVKCILDLYYLFGTLQSKQMTVIKIQFFAKFVSIIVIILSYESFTDNLQFCSFLSFISTADEITHGSESHLSGSRKWCVSLTVVYCVNPSGQQQTFQFVLRDLQSWHFEYRNVKNAPLNTIKRFSTLLQKYNFWHEKIHSQFKYFKKHSVCHDFFS